MQKIVQQYIDAEEKWPATAREIAAWAVANGHWQPQPSAVISQCATDISRAMREEYIKDPQGRDVRAKHAARLEGEQGVLWADMRTASPEHMKIALQQRRRQIFGDCRQLKMDADSYNENHNSGERIQLSFDFTRDLLESEAGDLAA